MTYSVTEDNALNIHYHATSDKPTIINLTNHAYWNLDGYDAGGILDTVLELHGSAFTPVVKGAIPTGEIRNVAGTVFDFTKPKKIGQDIDKDDEQLLLVGGYDHNRAAASWKFIRRFRAYSFMPEITLMSPEQKAGKTAENAARLRWKHSSIRIPSIMRISRRVFLAENAFTIQ